MRAAVAGSPIAHSLSPALHRAAYAHLGLVGWRYDAVECDAGGLPALLAGCGPDWAGLSLTMPLKEAVLPLLDTVDPLAAAVGAVNTVVLTGGGRAGTNTDIPGMASVLGPLPVAGGRAAVLGGGATARSAVAALVGLGATQVEVYLRTRQAGDALAAAASAAGGQVVLRDWADAVDALGCAVVVATTPAGVADALAPAVPPRPGLLLDVVYAPWPTALATAWGRAGGRVASGLDLLTAQAVDQVVAFTRTAVDGPVDRDALLAVLRRAGERALQQQA